MRKLNRFLNEGLESNHKNLDSNVSFIELPKWFQKAKTKDAKVIFKNGKLNWKDGTWVNGTWEGGTWEDGEWRDGSWLNGTWEDGGVVKWHLVVW